MASRLALSLLALSCASFAAPGCAADADTLPGSADSELNRADLFKNNPLMLDSVVATSADNGRRLDLVQGRSLSVRLPSTRTAEGKLVVWKLVGPLAERARALGIPNGSIPTLSSDDSLQLINWDTRVAEDLSGTHELRFEARQWGVSTGAAIDSFEITLAIAKRAFDFDVVLGDERPAATIKVVMGQRIIVRLSASAEAQWKLNNLRWGALGDPKTTWEPPTAGKDGLRTLVWDTKHLQRRVEVDGQVDHYVALQPADSLGLCTIDLTKWRTTLDIERELDLRIDLRGSP